MLRVSVNELAAALGITPRRCQQLADEGVFVRVERGEYDAVACARAYATMEASERAPTNKEEEELRKLRAQADREEIKRDRDRGAVIGIEVHEERLEARCEQIAAALRGLGRYRADVVKAKTDLEAAALLDRMGDEVLQALMDAADEIPGGAVAEDEGEPDSA